jgi:hypothetical protein
MSIAGGSPEFQTKTELWLKILFRWIFFWESDEKKLGTLLRLFRHSFIYSLGISLVLVHTLVPSYWLFLCIYGILALIWIQHLVYGDSIVNQIEKEWIGDNTCFVEPFLEAFHMPVTDETTRGVTIMTSTLLMIFLTLELTSRTILNINHYLSYLRL